MELREAIGHAIDGHAVLFVGAGYSRGAPAINGTTLSSARDFAEQLMAECGRRGPIPELDVATRFFERKKGREALVQLLRERFTVASCPASQSLVSEVRWKRIYTTNFDDLLEFAFHSKKKSLVSATLSGHPQEFAALGSVCVHLNGFARNLTSEKLDSELKLTSTSYLSQTVADSPWSYLFRSDVRAARAVIFLGYSMYDIDIQRILYTEDTIREKCVLVIAQDADDIAISTLEDFGSVFPIGLDGFNAELQDRLKHHVPAAEEPIYNCFQSVAVPTGAPEVRDTDLLALFLAGDLKDALVWRTLTDPAATSYYIARGELSRILDVIQQGKSDIVIHAEFANGKTSLVRALALEAASRGFQVYQFVTHGRSLVSEIEQLARSSAPTVVIIEGYVRLTEGVRQLFLNATSDVRIVLTARTADHEGFIDRLEELRGKRQLVEFDVNKLQPEELAKVCDLLDRFGLWGDKAAFQHEKKLRVLRSQYESEFQKILLDVLRSPQVIEKLRELTDAIQQDANVLELVIALCALDILQVSPTLDLIGELTDSSLARRPGFQRQTVVKRFIRIDAYGAGIRSPILAKHLLSDIISGDRTVDVLLKMAKRAETGAPIEPQLEGIFRSLQGYANVQFMLPEKNKRPLLIRYYEHLKNLSQCTDNPFFWLQYAIARMSFQDYENAGRYFETAYGLAKRRPGFKTIQIDNHYARFLLENCMVKNDVAGSHSQFAKAKQLLQRQMNTNMYYPFRVARLYEAFYSTFFPRWSDKEKREFLGACEQVLERAGRLKGWVAKHHYVIEARSKLSEILRRERRGYDART